MNLSSLIIIIVLVIVILFAIYKIIDKRKNGDSCCSPNDTIQPIKVKDTNKKHYPYKTSIHIDGMTCQNCAIKVQNALNTLEDTYAKVDISSKQATILTKKEPDINILKKTIIKTGYGIRE